MADEATDERPFALVVEDDASALQSRCQLFEAYGFCVRGAQSMEAAIRCFNSESVDIVITDINLIAADGTDRSGVELARCLKEQRPGLPIIGYSGHFAEDSRRSDEWGAFDAYFAKGTADVEQVKVSLAAWKQLALARRRVSANPGTAGRVGCDAFLSHNSGDKKAVRKLALALKARGVTVWFDEWELVPGRPWQEALERTIGTMRSAVVLVGRDGLGPWEDREMRACLAEFVRRGIAVIPVLLPGAVEPELPMFLRQFTWVDLRDGFRQKGIDRLEWGITGRKPDRQQLKRRRGAA